LPGASLVTLNDPVISGTGIANYSFSPGASFIFEDVTTYWLVVSGTNARGVFDWTANSTGIAPTGDV
jgi:hypothetical protein